VSEGTTVGGVAGVSGIQPVAGSAGIATITGVAGSAAVGGGGGADGMARATAGGAGGSVGSKNNCGARSGMRGKTSRSIMVSGSKRTFIAYLPQMANATQPLPFVYVFHGATQTGQQLYDMTEYAKLADSEGIAVVFPDGQGVSSLSSTGSLTPWSVTDGPPVCGAGTLVSNLNAVDFAFVDAIKTDLEQDQCIDDKHIYATGFSMGGYFTHHIACDRMDFRAAAPHSGGTMAALSSCTTGHMPIIIFHGTADPLIAGSCDDPKLSSDPSFPPSATLWAEKNGCKPTYTTIPANGTSGSNGTCYMYDGCPADGQVEMCSFQDMAHCWAGAPVCPGCIGEGPNYASATKLQWEFFKKYAW
jgi:polyhydroxybutyrate depolymerase